MECSIVQNHLFDYQENKLQPGMKEAFETHLIECEACQRLVSRFQSVEAVIDHARAEEPGPFIATRITNRIEQEYVEPGTSRRNVLRPVMITLSVLCAVAMGVVIGKVNSDRINGSAASQEQVEILKTELYIHDFIDENKTLIINE